MPPKKSSKVLTQPELIEELLNHVAELKELYYSNVAKPINVDDGAIVKFFGTIDQLINRQKSASHEELAPLEDRFSAFESWLGENGIALEEFPIKIKAEVAEGMGSGIVASKKIEFGDGFNLILRIPLKLMITSQNASESKLPIFTDPLLKQMPSIALALFLWIESKNRSSFWKPYIDTLPREFNLPIFWSRQELSYIKSPEHLAISLKLLMNTVLQYCHLYKLVHLTSNFPLADKFTYEGYRWAVGVVLSRQNEVPVAAPAGGSAASSSSAAAPDTVNVIALIPVWDLLNHSDACQKITTFFDRASNNMECYAPMSFEEGEQVFIFYGPRPSSELFQYSGFVVGDNRADYYRCYAKLLRPDDPLAPAKQALFRISNVNFEGDVLISPKLALGPELERVLRVAVATKEELQSLNSKIPSGEISLANEMRVQDFAAALIGEALTIARQQVPDSFIEGTNESRFRIAKAFQEINVNILQAALAHTQERKAALKKREKNSKKRQKKKQKEVSKEKESEAPKVEGSQ